MQHTVLAGLGVAAWRSHSLISRGTYPPTAKGNPDIAFLDTELPPRDFWWVGALQPGSLDCRLLLLSHQPH